MNEVFGLTESALYGMVVPLGFWGTTHLLCKVQDAKGWADNSKVNEQTGPCKNPILGRYKKHKEKIK